MNLADFILIDKNSNIFKNIFSEEGQNISQISGLKNQDNKFKISVAI